MSDENDKDGGERHDREVVIHVNTKPVRLKSHRGTGLAIKQAAVEQGVKIQLDFVLLEELEHHRTRQIGDAETITVTDKSQFQAIPHDDHS